MSGECRVQQIIKIMGELVVLPESPDVEYRMSGLIRRIKGLPVDLICRILLDLMKEKLLKDFIKTASFWQPWPCTKADILNLEVLDIREISLIKDGALSSFCSFMDWLIECYPSGKRLKGFSLNVQFPYNCPDRPASVAKWICFAADHDPEYISLDQHFVPTSMYSLYRLKSLHLARSPFPAPARHHRIDWPHLKELSAYSIWMGVDILPYILSGSPSLELLELKSCDGLYKIDLEKSRVKKLVVDSPWGAGQLEIIASNLLVLCLRRYCAPSRVKPLKLTRVYSLVEAELNFFNDEFGSHFCNSFGESSSFYNLKKIHDQLQHVPTLKIGYRGDDVVASMKNNGYNLQELTKCKQLTIDSGPDGINLLGFTTLLERCPHLAKLEVRRFGIYDEYKFNLRKRSRGSRWDQDNEFESLVKNLRHVKRLVVRWPDAGTGRAMTRTCDLENGGEEMLRSVAEYLRSNSVSIRKEGR